MTRLCKNGLPWPTRRDKTHCIKGHEFTPENTIERVVKKYGHRFRECRVCRTQWNKRSNVAPEKVQQAVAIIRSGKTLSSICFQRKGVKPLLRWNQLIPALQDTPTLLAELRETSRIHAIAARTKSNVGAPRIRTPGKSIAITNLRTPTLTGIIAAPPNELFTAIDAAVSRRLPRFIRDEVVSDLAEMMLTGQLSLADLPAAARKVTSRHYNAIRYAPPSLDAPAYRDGATPLIETISDGLWQ